MVCINGVVVWDEDSAAAFKAAYPEFQEVPDAVLARYFRYATRIVNNSKCSKVPCCERITLYELIIAHYAFSFGRGAGATGQVTSASQGSVSMSVQALSMGQFADPWLTSQYGTLFWEMTEKYRTFEYVAAPKACRRIC